eukprot:NODE_5443_length_1769_cov_14.126066.p1 GENE.NODE_5443_length_1769_cov_14.126066~~NODE_5443_length_1769_cov_14.126066.p1  ORF type:complete len:498 (-),score=125.75 NODE_5443_length_1769_cov_14.126066:150-1643(-)
MWTRDVVTGECALLTTGGKTWGAALRLCDYLEAVWPAIGLADRPPRVLELGAGTGWLGMTLARNVAATGGTVLLTEQPGGGAMEWLDHNIAQNRASSLPLAAVRTAAFDWADSATGGAELLAEPFDLLIGSDLVYDEGGVQCLPKAIRWLLDNAVRGLRVLYAHTLHRFDHHDLDFFERLRCEGLEYVAVAAEASASAGDLDPLAEGAGFLEELFPEMCVVVFQVQLAGAVGHLPWSDVLNASVAAPAMLATTTAVAPTAAKAEGGVVVVGRVRVVQPDAAESYATTGDASDIVVRLRRLGPFGSGEHPTTALMLQGLQELRDGRGPDGLVTCEYGCGSAVLSFAALKLGASRCVAIDIVLDALDAVLENARANGVDEASERPLQVRLPAAAELDRDLDFFSRYGDWRAPGAMRGWLPLADEEQGAFDLVLANIVVGPLCRLAPAIHRLLRAGGEVLLAGFKEGGQVRQVEEAYGSVFALRAVAALEGWALLHGRLL